jgi:hypothetical protein
MIPVRANGRLAFSYARVVLPVMGSSTTRPFVDSQVAEMKKKLENSILGGGKTLLYSSARVFVDSIAPLKMISRIDSIRVTIDD